MRRIFSGKKIKVPGTSNESEKVSDHPLNSLLIDLEELRKNIIDEELPEELVKCVLEPVFPLYCPFCGEGFPEVKNRCDNCDSEIDLSSYDQDVINLLTRNDELFFRPGTTEWFTYNLANDLKELYYSATTKSSYHKVSNYLLSITNNLKNLGKPFGLVNQLEMILDKLNVDPLNEALYNNLTGEFATTTLKLASDLISMLNTYLVKKSVGDYNYDKIRNYLKNRVVDEHNIKW